MAIGNISDWYQTCYTNTEGSILSLYNFVMAYGSITNYLTYLFPNMLSYAFVINSWINRMTDLEAEGDIAGLVYYYALIIRNVFFFTIPEEGTRYT